MPEDYGTGLALTDSQLAIGEPYPPRSEGRVHLYYWHGRRWRSEQLGPALSRSGATAFGSRLSLAGTLLAVTAPMHEVATSTEGEPISGMVHIYRRDRRGYAHEDLLKARAQDGFGESLLVAGDTVFVGASDALTKYDERSRPMQPLMQGAVYAFRRMAGQWDVTQVLRPSVLQSRAARPATFGVLLASSDGVLAVTAPGEISGNREQPGRGSVYLFERRGQTWEQTLRLRAPAGHNKTPFGLDMALGAGWLGVSGDKGVYLFERERRDRWVLRDTLVGVYKVAMGRDWLLTVAQHTAATSGRDWLQLFRRHGQRWICVARATIPPPPVATKHYGKKRFQYFMPALASDGRWVAITVRVNVDPKDAPFVQDPKYFYVSGVALYEIVPGQR